MTWTTNRRLGLWMAAILPLLVHGGDDDGMDIDAGSDAAMVDSGVDSAMEDAAPDSAMDDAGTDAGPPDPTLPLAVDDFFMGRAGFSGAPDEAPLHTEDDACPTRAGDEAGDCHRFEWDGTGGGFTGAVWIDGTGFPDAAALDIEDGANEVTFYAWGTTGDEVIEVGAGIATNGGGGDADGAQVREFIALSTTPTQYTIRLGDLVGYDTVVGAFVVAIAASSNPSGAEFYVDDIQWIEGTPVPTDPTLPMTVDFFFNGRAGFGSNSGEPLHTEDTTCPTRAPDPLGDCHHITYPGGPPGSFSGAFWVDGTGFGDAAAVDVEDGATAIQFYAWGAAGGERIEFGAGIPDVDGSVAGTAGVNRQFIVLTNAPVQYTVPITRLRDYTDVTGAFIFAAGGEGALEFYIDDITWVDDGTMPATVPVTVDTTFPDRSAFGDGGAPLHTETTDSCPSREGGMAGLCHTFTWDGTGGGFTGALWTIGTGFQNLRPAAIDPGANAVRFYAWSASGSPVIEFGVGDAGQGDIGQARSVITLSTTPTEYVIPLAGLASYQDGWAGFFFAGNNGANPSGFNIYVDDIQWAAVSIPVDLRPDAGDAVIHWDGGTPSLQDPAAGGAAFGNPTGAAVYVVPFVLPTLPPGGTFTEANFQVAVELIPGTDTGDINNIDLYGLGFRTAADVAGSSVLTTSMFYEGDTPDAANTLIQSDFLTPTSPTAFALTETDGTGDMNLVDYLNAQVTAGAVAGDYVYLRLNSDVGAPIAAGYTYIVGAAASADAPPTRPTLTVQ